jgi:hypothetical protein
MSGDHNMNQKISGTLFSAGQVDAIEQVWRDKCQRYIELHDAVAYHADGSRTVRIPLKRTWVGLTDEEVAEILCDDRWQMRPELMLLACQAKLKEKNGG